MAQILQPLDAHPALILRLWRETVQPIEHGNGLRILLVEDNRNLGHNTFLVCSHICEQQSRGARRGPGKYFHESFKNGVHYLSPRGLRLRFNGSAVEAWLEQKDQPKQVEEDLIPMARGYFLGKPRLD